jgi:hypothetical protein
MAIFIRWGEGHAFMDDATELRGRPRELISVKDCSALDFRSYTTLGRMI